MRAWHLFLTIPHPCLSLPPPHQTIWSTFSPCLRIWPILCTQFLTMARVVVGSGGSDLFLLLNSHILGYARCLAGKVCGLVWSTWGTSQGEDKPGARDRILNTKVARRANLPPPWPCSAWLLLFRTHQHVLAIGTCSNLRAIGMSLEGPYSIQENTTNIGWKCRGGGIQDLATDHIVPTEKGQAQKQPRRSGP